MNTSPSRREGGYSMIELLVALVLIAILVGMAAPSMQGFTARNKTRGALDRLSGDVVYARTFAVKHSRRTWVRLQADGTYSVDTVAVSGDTVPIKRVDLVREYPGLSLASPSVSRLEFNSRGLVTNLTTSDDQFIRMVAAGVRDSLRVSPVGRVYRAY